MSAALEYHRATNVDAAGTDEADVLDPATWRYPFKDYGAGERLPLDVSVAGPLLRDGAGIVRSRPHPRWRMTYHFRGYSSAGALYPVEAYVVGREGILSFDALAPGFVQIRAGDGRGALAEAAAAPELAQAGAVVVLTGVHARTGWKYLERGYRHVWWDGGTMLANLLALAAAGGLRPRLYVGFVDREVNELLGVDGVREYAVALLALGDDHGRGEGVSIEVLRLPEDGPRYPVAERLHAASSLPDAAAVRAWRIDDDGEERRGSRDELVRAIRRRGSVREYADDPLPRDGLEDLLSWSGSPVPADAPPVVRQVVTAAAVEGLEPGVYDAGLRLLRAEAVDGLRDRVGFAAMEQDHPRMAAANVFQLADVEAVVARLGDRGYRWAQLEAGIRAGRLQVGAFARGWGAAASTFYDAEVSRLLGTMEAPMLMVALGPRIR